MYKPLIPFLLLIFGNQKWSPYSDAPLVLIQVVPKIIYSCLSRALVNVIVSCQIEQAKVLLSLPLYYLLLLFFFFSFFISFLYPGQTPFRSIKASSA